MPAEETLRISLQADLREMQKSLATLPGISEREAKLMVAGLSRELGKATAAAKRAATDSEKAWSKAGQGIKGALSQVGGAAGQLGGIVFEVGEKLTTAGAGLGALGAIGAGAVVGIAAAGVAARGLADAALLARDRLEEQGVSIGESGAALDRYESSSSALRTEMDQLTVALGSVAADGLSEVAFATIGLIDGFERLAEKASPIADTMQAISDATFWINPVRVEMYLAGEAMSFFAGKGEEVAAVTRDNAKAANEWAAAENDALVALGMLDDAVPPVTRGIRDNAAALREAEDAAADLVNGLGDVRQLEAEAAAARARATEATEAQAAATRDLAEAERERMAELAELGDFSEMIEALDSQVADFRSSLVAGVTEAAAAISSTFGGITSGLLTLRQRELDTIIATGQAQVANAEQEAELRAAASSQLVADQLASGAISEAEADRRQAAIDAELSAELSAASRLADNERDMALQSFRATQSMQRAEAIMEAASAALTMIPAFAWMGPGAPIGAAAAAGAALATQLAVISSTPPPQFPTGLDPDHRRVVAIQDREAIASRRAMGNPAVREALTEGNRGVRTGKGSAGEGGTRVLVGLDARTGRLRVTTERIGKRSTRRR